MSSLLSPKAWARKNKRKFANSIIKKSGAVSQEDPSAYFMAGLPGSGKTEYNVNLIRDLDLKVVRIDMDEIAEHIEGYEPEQASAFREAATDMLNALFDATKRGKFDFIMDGTFGSKNALTNIEMALKKSYTVKVFYQHQNPSAAWGFTKDREKVEKRGIELDGFIDSYFSIRQNISRLVHNLPANTSLDLVIKKDDNSIDKITESVSSGEIDALFEESYTRDELYRILKV